MDKLDIVWEYCNLRLQWDSDISRQKLEDLMCSDAIILTSDGRSYNTHHDRLKYFRNEPQHYEPIGNLIDLPNGKVRFTFQIKSSSGCVTQKQKVYRDFYFRNNLICLVHTHRDVDLRFC